MDSAEVPVTIIAPPTPGCESVSIEVVSFVREPLTVTPAGVEEPENDAVVANCIPHDGLTVKCKGPACKSLMSGIIT